jgi:hypothetical protein
VSQPAEDGRSGSYDDLPEDGVHTVLNIPIRLEVDGEPLQIARGRHRAPAPRTIVPAPPHRGPVQRFLHSEHPVHAATTVGVTAGLIVFTVVALTMAAVAWLVH